MAKNFKSPAMNFISVPGKDKGAELHESPMKKNPEMIETKSKRLQLLMQPSLHKKIKSEAKIQNTSVNDLIHKIMEQYFKQV